MANFFGLVSKALPTKAADGNTKQSRSNGYGDLVVAPSLMPPSVQAAEGSRFAISNPTFGTAVAGSIQTAFADTNALCLIRNNDAVGGKDITLDFLRFTYAVAPASATSAEVAISIDTTNRYSSGGSGPLTPLNVNTGSAVSSISLVYFGAVTATAVSAVRRFGRAKIKHAIPVVGDQVQLDFGALDTPMGPISGASPNAFAVAKDPVVIAPGHSALIHVWHPANAATAPTYEFDLGLIER